MRVAEARLARVEQEAARVLAERDAELAAAARAAAEAAAQIAALGLRADKAEAAQAKVHVCIRIYTYVAGG